MTLFFPDVNVWLALSVESHEYSDPAWHWIDRLPRDARLVFSRHTQIGLLRVLCAESVMGSATLALGKAWSIYDQWIEDARVEFYPEPKGAEDAFRRVSSPFASQKASKALGDCWLLAFAMEINAALVTFDRGLYDLARRQGQTAVIPSW